MPQDTQHTRGPKQTTLRSIAAPVGAGIGAVGVISLVIGIALNLTWSQPDANIGAGLFVVAGVVLLIVGLTVFGVSKLLGPR